MATTTEEATQTAALAKALALVERVQPYLDPSTAVHIEDSGGSYIRDTYEFGYPAVSFHFATLEQRLTLLGLFDGWEVQDNGVAKVLSDGVLVTVFTVREVPA